MPRPTFSEEAGRYRNVQLIDFNNPTAADAFGRFRVSTPTTIFDSKALSEETIGLFYDDVEASGGGTLSTYSKDRASFTMAVTDATAGKRIRQTKQRFNYQPGKSQLVLITGVFGDAGAGITKRLGYFDENNGIGMKIGENGASFFIRSNVSGTPIDIEVDQDSWDMDDRWPLNNLNDIDFTKSQIFFMDFEWLGVGSIRFGFVVDGMMIPVYQRNNANNLDSVYMSTPNLPVRYELENDGTGGDDSMEVICTTVISEGGQEETGLTRYISNAGTQVDANVAGTIYALIGLRLKTTNLDSVVKIISSIVLCNANPNFEWMLILNPTVAGTFTYNDLAGSAVQYALGATANTATGGTILDGGYTTAEVAAIGQESNLYYMGSKIDGTRDEIVLCARPLQANADIFGGIKIREFL